MNEKTILYEVYPTTKWSIQLFKYENIGQLPLDSFQVLGLDSSRNYLPQEVIDYITLKRMALFSKYKNYLTIKVWRNQKWETIFNWPIEKFNPTVILPHRRFFI